MENLHFDDFRNPLTRPRIAPFWFWNCAMDETKVRHQVRQMKKGGCGGFFIHPRQGLTLPYLSKAWFARVRAAVEEAQKCGLEAWLYDEYPYPSGIAGGLVTANHPEFRARELKTFDFPARGHEKLRSEFPLGRVICALAAPLENGVINWDEAIDVRDEIGVVLTQEQFWLWPMGHIPTNEKRFMSEEGRLILEWTPPCGEWQIFVGIEREQRGFKYYDCFFDPLCPGASAEFLRLTHEKYKAHLGEFFGNTIPGIFTDEIEPPAWSPEIEKTLDLDFARVLPALKRDDHSQAAEIRFQVRACALKLFEERWETPIATWCHANDLIWGAEKPTWRPAQFWNVAEPSTDAGHRRIPAPPEPLTADLRANHRAAISAAEQNGTEEVRCECFHSLGWGATLQDQKWQFDWLTVQGVNRFTPHAFYGTSAGLKKHDAAPSFFAENPYWPHFHLLGDYTARLSLAMSSGREKARLALLHPTETVWRGGEAAKNAIRAFVKLQNQLLQRNIQFHIADVEAILRATPQNGGLEIGNARYEAVITPCDAPEFEVVLQKAREAGLAVWNAADLKDLEAQRPLKIVGGDEKIWALWRETGEQELIFFANTSGEKITAQIEVAANVASWESWSLETGERAAFAAQIATGNSRFALDLPPYGSALLVGGSQATAPAIATQSEEGASPALPIPLEGAWKLKLDRPNALRLNQWKAVSSDENFSARAVDDQNWPAIEALPLRFRDARGAGWKNQIERRDGESVWYRRRIEAQFVPENLEILVENGAIAGDWTLFVNGHEIPRSAFTPREYNGEDKTAAPVARYFQTGENVLVLKVENAPEMGGLLTPLHLLGDFALVGENRRTLAPLPETVRFNDLVSAGLPHFSGCATYTREIDVPDAKTLELPSHFGEIAAVRVAGHDLGARMWSPYRWNLPNEISGSVEAEVAVTNTLLPFVEGQTWNAVSGTAQKF